MVTNPTDLLHLPPKHKVLAYFINKLHEERKHHISSFNSHSNIAGIKSVYPQILEREISEREEISKNP